MKGFSQIWLIIGAVIIIIAGGIFFLGRQAFPKPPQTQNPVATSPVTFSPSPTPNLTANPDSIGDNWKTYTGKYFSLEYPSAWFLVEEKPWRTEDLFPVVKLSPVKTNSQSISIVVSKLNGLNLDQFIQEKRGLDSKIFKPITVGGVEGRIASYVTAFDAEGIFISNAGHIIEIMWTKSPGEKIEKSTFDQILSTFKFQ